MKYGDGKKGVMTERRDSNFPNLHRILSIMFVTQTVEKICCRVYVQILFFPKTRKFSA